MKHDHNHNGEPVEKAITKPAPAENLLEFADEPAPISPLGWSIRTRLLAAAGAAALLWLAVAWALGWFE